MLAISHSHIQIESFTYSNKIVSSTNINERGYEEQILTTKPSLSFYFNMDSIILRPAFVINSNTSSTEGSFSLGGLWKETIEFGGFLKLNRNVKEYGENENKNAIVESDFSIAPYIVFYPFADEKQSFECLLRGGYLYKEKRITTSGVGSLMNEKRGAYIFTQLTYSRGITPRIAWSPNISTTYEFLYNTTQDSKQNIWKISFLPISLRILM